MRLFHPVYHEHLSKIVLHRIGRLLAPTPSTPSRPLMCDRMVSLSLHCFQPVFCRIVLNQILMIHRHDPRLEALHLSGLGSPLSSPFWRKSTFDIDPPNTGDMNRGHEIGELTDLSGLGAGRGHKRVIVRADVSSLGWHGRSPMGTKSLCSIPWKLAPWR